MSMYEWLIIHMQQFIIVRNITLYTKKDENNNFCRYSRTHFILHLFKDNSTTAFFIHVTDFDNR